MGETSLLWQINLTRKLTSQEKDVISEFVGRGIANAWQTLYPGEPSTIFVHAYDLDTYLMPSNN